MSTATEFISSSAFFDSVLPPSNAADSKTAGGRSSSASNAEDDFADRTQSSPARSLRDDPITDDVRIRSPPSSGEPELPSMSNQQTPSPLFDDAPLVGHSVVDCAYCHKPYRKPRVLHCLHAMCEDCIIAQLEGHRFEEVKTSGLECELEPSGSPAVRPPPGVIRCPVCQQDSNVGNDMRFVNQLLLDYVRMNELEAKTIDKQQRPCEACKSDDAAVALCQDCSSNLCSNCVQAHHFMRCFEGHKVVSFAEIKRATECGEALYIHRPVVCGLHNEQYRSLCVTCEMLVCAQCELCDHKAPDHHIIAVSPQVDSAVRHELTSLCGQAEEKAKVSETAHEAADEQMSELSVKLEKAKEAVERTFAEFEELLTKKKESFLDALEKTRDEQENQLSNTFQRIENSVEKIVDAVEFTKRLTAHANTMELLDSRKTVKQQLTQLLHSIPNPNVYVDLSYSADVDRFQQAIYTCCGAIRKGIHAAPAQIVNPKELKPEPVVPTTQFRPVSLNLATANSGGGGGIESTAPTSYATVAAPVPADSMNNWTQPTQSARGPPPAPLPLVPAQAIQQQLTSPLYGGPGAIGMERGNRQMPNAPPMRSSVMGWTNEDQLTILARQIVGYQNAGSAASTPVMTPQPQQQQQQPPLQASNWGQGFAAASGAGPVGTHNTGYHNQNRFTNSRGTTPTNGWTQQPTASDINALSGRMSAASMAPPTNQYPDFMYGYGTQNAAAAPPGAVSVAQMAPGQLRQPSLRRTPVDDGAHSDHDRTSSNTPSDSGAIGSGKPSSARSPKPMNSLHMFGSLGPAPGQFNSPHGFCLGLEDEIVVADTNNHRIQVMSKSGAPISHFGKPGKGDGELFYPRKVALIRGRDPRYVVCDRGNERSRMQVFSRRGEFLKKIVIRYVDIVAGLSVDSDGKIIVVDSVSPTVFRINSDTGELEKWFDCSEYMKEPSDIAVFGREYFICDFKGNCVCVFADDGRFMRKIGSEDLTPFPNGIDVSNHGDVLIGDSHGNRFHVSVFKKSGEFVQDFECATVKVSRCCGLRITGEGYVVTLAKNNHHLLVLDTLYVH